MICGMLRWAMSTLTASVCPNGQRTMIGTGAIAATAAGTATASQPRRERATGGEATRLSVSTMLATVPPPSLRAKVEGYYISSTLRAREETGNAS